jgi:FG-GAP-like repeat
MSQRAHPRILSAAVLTLVCVAAPSCGGGGGGGGGGGASSGVTAPSTGSFWAGTKIIRWATFDFDTPTVTIDISSDGGSSYPVTLVAGTADDGKYTWDTSAQTDGGTYRLRVRASNGSVVKSGVFTLDNTAPVVTLGAPNGGDLWGGARDVTWTTTDDNPELVDILASSNGGASFDIAVTAATPDDGTHTWDTSGEADGGQYRVQLVATDRAGNQSLAVSSLANFELDNSAPSISLLAPLGAEDWDATRAVLWSTTDPNPGTVEIRLSTNGGVSYGTTIVAAAADTGSYDWQTGSAPDGSTMRVQVRATDGAGNTSAPDSSPANFTITNLRLLDPVHYLDVNGNAQIDGGDELYLLFDKDIQVNSADPSDLTLSVAGDSLGAGATVAMGPELRSVVVTLGSGPVLRTRGAFDAGALAALDPAGIDISASMTANAIEALGSGRDAVPSNPKDVTAGMSPGTALPAGSDTPGRGALGDLDGDGDLDLVVTSTGGAPDVRYAGDGAGGWTAVQTFGAADSYDMALGDLDGDGDLDLALAISGANTIWFNDGSGFLSDSGQTLGNSDSRAIALVDVDCDGDLDILVGNGSGQANRIWTNSGVGTFSDSGQALGSSSTLALAVGDLDGDGDLDLVGGNDAAANQIWLNTSGSFSAGSTATITQTRDLALGDLDGDGDLDLFVAAVGQNEVLMGDGAGNFAPAAQYLGNNTTRGVSLLDLDGDGDLDAVTAKYLDSERYWINDGGGIFTEDPRRGSADDSTDVLCGRVDGDADLDLVVINELHQHRTYLASLAGGQPAAAYADSGAGMGLWRSGVPTAGDVDGDGDQDVLLSDRAGATQVLLSDGVQSLLPAGAFGGLDGRGGDLVDVDCDGDLDYLRRVGDPGSTPDQLWMNDGGGQFTDTGAALGLDSYAAGDLDSDGDVDLIVINASQFEVWANDGSGGFNPTGQIASTSGYLFLDFGDLDNDGDLDVVYGQFSTTQIWRNDGAGNFSLATTVTPGGANRSLALADYDRDGDLDLLVGSNSPGLAVVRNDGGLSFSAQGVSGPATDPSQVLTLDTNEDGQVDYLLIDDNATRWYLVLGNGGAVLPAPTGVSLSNLVWALPLDLNGDGDQDLYFARDDAVSPAGVTDLLYVFD